MTTRLVATILGGSGFIGRYVVRRLAREGYVVRVAGRDPMAAQFLRTAGRVGQVVPMFASAREPGTIARVLEGADLVVNLIGTPQQRRRDDFRRLNAELPGHIGRLAAAGGTRRVVHISGIGADPKGLSAVARSKAQGEAALREAMPRACILRPSVVFGPEDRFFNPLARAMQFLPFSPVVMGAAKFQPVYVGDVADAILAGLLLDSAAGETFELGGPRIWTMREAVDYVRQVTQRHKPFVTVPAVLAMKRSLRQLMAQDNVVAPGAKGLLDLGIVPTPVEMVVPSYLARYAPGGGKIGVISERPGAGTRQQQA